MGKYWWRHIFNKLLKFPLAYMESAPNEAGSVNGVQNASNEKASGSDTQRCSKEEASAGGVQRVPKRKGLLPDVQKATNQKASGNDIQRTSKKKASASGSKVVLNGKASLSNVQEVPQEKASDSNLADKKTTSDSAGFQKVLNWNMLVLAEPRRIRSHLRKVKDTLKYDTFEEVEEEKEIHSWSSLSRAGFMFVLEPEKVTFFERLMVHHKYKIYNEGKNEYDPWGLIGKFGDISILKYDEAYVIPLLMKLQIAAAEVARIWRPKKKMLSEICFMLNDRSDQPLWWKQRKYKKMKDFHCYLVFILAHKEELSVQVRQAAGLVLTNNVQMKFDSLSPGCTHYIKSELLPCITTKNKAIRSTAGTTIAVLFQWIRVAGWMELFKELYQCINSQDICKNEDALDVLLKITEIGAEHLNEAVRGLPKRPIDVFIPILMKFMKFPHDNLRKLALGCVSNCIVLSPLPWSLDTSMDECLQQLSNLFNDTSSDVREKVCSTWGQLIKVHPSRSKLLIKNIIESKLEAMKDSIKEVALKACQFWCAYCDDSRPYGELKEFLPNLITTFLQNMVLTKEDSSHAVFEDLHPLKEVTIRENLDDVYTLDLRICSAAGLTGICGVLWDDAFPVFMSLIEAKMAQMDDRAWKEREAAVASIGAIAKAHVTKPRFSQILALLIPPLDDNFSLVRFSTCRTISVCGKLIIEGLGHTTGDEQFMVFLMGLVRRTADSDRIVKEAAIAALESLQEEIKTKQLQAEVQDALQSYIQVVEEKRWSEETTPQRAYLLFSRPGPHLPGRKYIRSLCADQDAPGKNNNVISGEHRLGVVEAFAEAFGSMDAMVVDCYRQLIRWYLPSLIAGAGFLVFRCHIHPNMLIVMYASWSRAR
ncbi:transportin-1-like [Lolium rigidum]|uniref:transportin-1-like n=1 Tax=Lolium rigidum TaxID=89674 RepID=UPI001F5C63CA|nr:transportin-1-like [Lolium rigidum]